MKTITRALDGVERDGLSSVEIDDPIDGLIAEIGVVGVRRRRRGHTRPA